VPPKERKIASTPEQQKAAPSPLEQKPGLDAPGSSLDKNANPSELDEVDTPADSSESADLDPDVEPAASAAEAGPDAKDGDDHETKGLVPQQDSFEEELPYVPTTLPLERYTSIKNKYLCKVKIF